MGSYLHLRRDRRLRHCTGRALLAVAVALMMVGCGSSDGSGPDVKADAPTAAGRTAPKTTGVAQEVASPKPKPTFARAKACIERAGVRAGKPFPTLLKAYRARDADPGAAIRIIGPDDDDWWAYVSIDADAKRSARVLSYVNSDPDGEANMTSPDMFQVGTGADFAWWIPTGTGEFGAMFAGPELDKIHRCVGMAVR
jgi:hypothetical protein